MAGEIFRQPTASESKDFKQLGRKTIMHIFNVRIAQLTQEFLKKGKPFDEPCARLDFADKLQEVQQESERTYGYVREDVSVDLGDLNKYGDESRFDMIEDQEDYVDKVIEGSRTQVIVGHTITYKCKSRGHKIGVFIPSSKYQKTEEKVENKKEK